MVIVGLILFILGLLGVTGWLPLTAIGLVLIVVGLIINLVPINGKNYRIF